MDPMAGEGAGVRIQSTVPVAGGSLGETERLGTVVVLVRDTGTGHLVYRARGLESWRVATTLLGGLGECRRVEWG